MLAFVTPVLRRNCASEKVMANKNDDDRIVMNADNDNHKGGNNDNAHGEEVDYLTAIVTMIIANIRIGWL